MPVKFVDVAFEQNVIYRDRIELQYREWVFERVAFYSPICRRPNLIGVIIKGWVQGEANNIRVFRIVENPRPWVIDYRISVLPLSETLFPDFIQMLS